MSEPEVITLSSDEEVQIVAATVPPAAAKREVKADPNGEGPSDAELLRRLQEKVSMKKRSVCQMGDLSSGQEKHPVPVFNDLTLEIPHRFLKYGLVSRRRPAHYTREPTCKCTNGKCNVSKCRCWRLSTIKLKDGQVQDLDKLIANPLDSVLLECRESCACKGRCNNVFTSTSLPFRMEVERLENKGWGVRVRDYVPKGSFFCEYVGDTLHPNERKNVVYQYTIEEANGRENQSVIDARDYSNIGRFINHSCNPCLSPFVYVRSTEASLQFPQLGFLANKDIIPGTEVSIHYGEGYWDAVDFACECGSAECIKPSDRTLLRSSEEYEQGKALEKQQEKRDSEMLSEYQLCLKRMEQIKAGKTFEEVLAAEAEQQGSSGLQRQKKTLAEPKQNASGRPQSPLLITSHICID